MTSQCTTLTRLTSNATASSGRTSATGKDSRVALETCLWTNGSSNATGSAPCVAQGRQSVQSVNS